jgi:hypothetical protein
MRIEIQGIGGASSSQEVRIRAVLFNDGYDPVPVSRNAFVGPSVRAPSPMGMPLPESVEPTFGGPDEPLTLQPFSFYGRERSFNGLPVGVLEVAARYQPSGSEAVLEVVEHLVVDE